VTGTNFAEGATLAIGGVQATRVELRSPSILTAVTGQHAAGAADVVVSVGNASGTLSDGYTYVRPGPANNPAPTINSVIVQGSRPHEPAQFADLDEEVSVTASVQDAETPADELAYEWSVETGTLTGSGPTVKWRAPQSGSVPAVVTIKVTVVERYATIDGTGAVAVHENRVDGSTLVNLHDSPKEVGNLAVLFLTDFSHSDIPPATVVRNFTDECRGKADELNDVRNNRQDFYIDAYEIGTPRVTVAFDGTCSFRSRPADACAAVPVRWDVTRLATGAHEVAVGTDHVTAVLLQGVWYLCDSDFDPSSTATALRFKK
jgi:hypothetical protein